MECLINEVIENYEEKKETKARFQRFYMNLGLEIGPCIERILEFEIERQKGVFSKRRIVEIAIRCGWVRCLWPHTVEKVFNLFSEKDLESGKNLTSRIQALIKKGWFSGAFETAVLYFSILESKKYF